MESMLFHPRIDILFITTTECLQPIRENYHNTGKIGLCNRVVIILFCFQAWGIES